MTTSRGDLYVILLTNTGETNTVRKVWRGKKEINEGEWTGKTTTGVNMAVHSSHMNTVPASGAKN